MRTILIILFGLMYLLGLWTIDFLDNSLPENLRNSNHHYATLIIMWICTPIWLVLFAIEQIIDFFSKPNTDGEN